MTSVLSLIAGFVTGKFVHFLLTAAYVYATMNCFKQYRKKKLEQEAAEQETGEDDA